MRTGQKSCVTDFRQGAVGPPGRKGLQGLMGPPGAKGEDGGKGG